jgi:hypothetical protein
MTTNRAHGMLAAVAIMLSLGARAGAQLAKQGTYTGKFGWYAIGKTFDIEKDHMLFVGEFNGTVFNDTGSGFLHGTAFVCPGMNDVLRGLSLASQGYCVVTDKDGDKAFLTWKGRKMTEPSRVAGDYQWANGTGKYTGITGNNTFEAIFITPTAGYSALKGKWKLPWRGGSSRSCAMRQPDKEVVTCHRRWQVKWP